MKTSNVLVTGGAGFIGANLVKYLLRHDYQVASLDKLTYAGNLGSLADVDSCTRHRFVRGDIADTETVGQLLSQFAPSAIIHLAAESHVDRSIDGPSEFIQTNIVGTMSLLQAALDYWGDLPEAPRKRFRFVHVSTDEVFGSLGRTGHFTEQTRYDPRSPYSASKASSDHLARAWNTTYGLPVIVTNCSNNFGPYQFPEKLIPVVILKCLSGEPIPVYGDGSNIRDWLFVEDHCAALRLVVENGTPGETYNIGGDNEQTNLALVRNLCRILDDLSPRQDGRPHEKQIVFVTDRPGHDARYAIDASKIKAQLGWQPTPDYGACLRRTVQWYLDNQSWWQDILSGQYTLARQGLADQERDDTGASK